MTLGKKRCKILKEIRQKIADENDIAYVTSECKYQGECLGSCPKCEAELRYLEKELEKKRRLGKAVTVAGLAVTVAMTAPSCTLNHTLAGEPENATNVSETIDIPGEIVQPDSEDATSTMGVSPVSEEVVDVTEGEPVYYHIESIEDLLTLGEYDVRYCLRSMPLEEIRALLKDCQTRATDEEEVYILENAMRITLKLQNGRLQDVEARLPDEENRF